LGTAICRTHGKPMKLVAALFLAFTIVLALAKDWQTVVEYAPVVGLAALLFKP
jgi:hypothetical protein